MRNAWNGNRSWVGVAAGLAIGLGAAAGASQVAEPAAAQEGESAAEAGFTLSVGQLRINQRISQAAVRRSNQSLGLLDPLITEPSNPAKVIGWGTAQIADDAITQAKLAPEVANRQTEWAVVNPDGTLVRASGGVTGTARAAGFAAGTYTVTFNRPVTGCAYTGTIGSPNTTPPPLAGLISVYVNPNESQQVLTVRTYPANGGDADDDQVFGEAGTADAPGDEQDRAFQVTLNC